MAFPLNPAQAPGGASHRRADARARRRGQRQDARHHREDRASRRAGRRAVAHRRDHVHQQGRARDARARARAARGGGTQGRRGRGEDLDVPRARARASSAPRRRRWACKPGFSVMDPQDLEPIVGELVATADRSRTRKAQWAISRWKNALVTPAEALRAAKDDDERAAAKAYAGLRGHARGVPGGRLRRPDPAAGRAPRARRRGARAMAGARGARARRRVPGHQPGAVPAVPRARRRAGALHRGRRRRPGDLRLARRDGRQPRRPRARLSGPRRREARAELPVDDAHPAAARTR